MYTSLKRPRVGDRVRLTGFLGIFEIVRVRPDGSLVDLKHLDLHQTAYIEQEVSAHDLIYVRGPQPADPCSRPAETVGASTSRPTVPTATHRPATSTGYPQRTAAPVSGQRAYASQGSSRKS